MKRTLKNLGARVLSILLVFSMFTQFLPLAGAATATPLPNDADAGDTDTTGQPVLSVDFLGDDKTNHTLVPPTGAPPATDDWYYTDDKSQIGTIFWVGIGIDKLDKFALKDGIFSLEAGFYYNSEFIEPYTGLPDPVPPASPPTPDEKDAAYLQVLKQYNESFWGSDYKVITAFTGLEPQMDDATQEVIEKPSNADIMAGGTWKMTNIAIEKTAHLNDVSTNRFRGTAETKTQYIAYIPFVLKQYDGNQALCLRLIRNATHFTIASGAGGYQTFGAWERNTTRLPDNDLKLMVRFSGDLNIFKAPKVPDTEYTATLKVQNAGVAANNATLGISNDKSPNPAKVQGDDAVLRGLTEGMGLDLDLTCRNGFEATVKVTDSTTGEVTVTTVTENQKYTFTMPGDHVTVSVEFKPKTTGDIEYELTLAQKGTPDGVVGNKAWLSSDKGQSDSTTVGNQTLPATQNTPVTVHVNCRIDYYAKVTVKDINGTPIIISSTSTDATSETDGNNIMTMTLPVGGTVTFNMPGADVLVDVEYLEANKYQSNLVVGYDSTVNVADKSEKDLVQLSYPKQANDNTPGMGYSGIVGHDPAQVAEGVLGNPASGVTGNKDLYTKVQKDQTVTVTMQRDPNHQVKSIVVTPKTQPDPANPITDLVLTPAAVTGNNHLFTATFVQPDYEVDVKVAYELRPLRKLELVLNGTGNQAANTAKATGTGKDDQPVSTDLDAATQVTGIEVYEKSDVVITIGKASGYSIQSIKLVDSSDNNYFTSSMVTTAPDGTKTVKFKMPTADIKAQVTYAAGVDPTYTAKLDLAYAAGSAENSNNSAKWDTNGSDSITSAEGAHHEATVNVEKGYYIQSVTMRSGDGAAYPITVSGDGYNNGAGGKVTLGMDMPAKDVTVTVTLVQGAPPVEPEFEATLQVRDDDNVDGSVDNHAQMSFVNHLGGSVSTKVVKKDGNDTLAGIYAGDKVTLAFTAQAGYYVADVVVTPASLNVVVEWNGVNRATFIMPAGDVSVAVVFRSEAVVPPKDHAPGFTVGWEQLATTPSDDNKVTMVDTTKLVKNQVITDNPQTIDHLTIPGDTVTMTLQIAPGFWIGRVTAVANGVMIPVTIPDSAKTAGPNLRTEAVSFAMPNDAVQVMVTYVDATSGGTEDDLFAGLTVQDDENATGADNWAMLRVNAAATSRVVKDGTDMLTGVKAGDMVEVTWHTDTGYVLDAILVTPAGLGVIPTVTGPNSAEFIMPADSVMVLVRFRSAAVAPLYTANLVIRGIPVDKTLADVGSASFSGAGTPPVYSITAPAGKTIGVDIFAQAGYYIEAFEVTPAALKVGTTLTGIFAAQAGSFTMPAANCTVNVTFGGGWPDSVAYNAILWVTDPNAEADNHASIKNLSTDRTQTSPEVSGGKSALITGCEGDVMEVTFSAAAGYQAEILLKDSAGKTVPYAWTSERTVSFRMPPNHISAEVRYREGAPAQYDIEVFVEGTAADKIKLDSTFDSVSGGTLEITGADKNGTLPKVRAGSTVLAEASTVSGRYVKALLVMAGGELIALQAGVGTETLLRGSFTMPKKSVKVYVYFAEGTPPTGDQTEYAAALTVTEAGGSAAGAAGQAAIQTVAPPVTTGLLESRAATPLASGPVAVAQSNGVPVYISVTDQNRIQVAATPQGSYTVDDIRLTPIGSSLSFSVKFDWLDKNTVEFDMPNQPVAVEVLMSAAEPTYTAQVLVNNDAYTGRPGTSVNSATISDGGTAVGQGSLLENLRVGAPINVGLTIGAGYSAEVSVVADSGSSTPLSVDADAVTQAVGFGMPASNVIVYVKFVRVADVNYSATLLIVSDKPTTQANVALNATLSDGTKTTVNLSGQSIKNLLGKEKLDVAVTTDAADPSQANTMVAAVLITTKAGTSYMPEAGAIYSAVMPKEDITVTVVLAEKTAGLYVAAMERAGNEEALKKAGNTLTSIKNLTETTLPGSAKSWTAARAKNVVEVAFATEAGYYASVKAVDETTKTELPVLQQGVTGSGKARFAMPSANVQVTVTYSNKAPTDVYPIEMIFSGHDKAAKNELTLNNTDTAAELAKLTGDGAVDGTDLNVTVGSVTIGTPLDLKAVMDENYRVKSALLAVGTGDSYVSMDVALTAADQTTSTGGFYMPNMAATLTVTYKSGYSATLVMADNSASKGSTATLEDDTGKTPITVDDTTKTATMEQLLTGGKITTTPTAGAASILRGILLTKGNGTTYLPEAGADSGKYLYAMESEDVTVTTVFDENTGKAYIAAVELAGDSNVNGNTAAIVNTSAATAGETPLAGDIWTLAEAGDELTVTVSLAEGYVAKITAKTAGGTSIPVDPIAVGSDGSTSVFAMPDTPENVLVTVDFAKGKPTPRPYDPTHAAEHGYTDGWIQAANNNDGENVTVTVPTLGAETKAGDGTITLDGLQNVYVAANPDATPPVEEFEVAYTFYLESTDEPGTYVRLKAGVDYTISEPPTRTNDYVFDGVTYTSEQFTFTALTDNMKKLVSGGGTLYITSVSKNLTKPLPESYRTALDVPALSLWAKPYDPERINVDADTVGSVNNNGILTVSIPTLIDVKGRVGSVPAETVTENGVTTDFQFRFYLNDTPGQPATDDNCTELIWGDSDTTKNNIILAPVDPAQTSGNYTYGDSYTPPGATDSLVGVRFYMKAVDPTSAIGEIMANLGSENGGHSLYVKAVADITENSKTVTRESDYVPLIVPQYYTLSGTLNSYAPTHGATLSLYRYNGTGSEMDSADYEVDPTVTTKIDPDSMASYGKVEQSFAFKSSLLLEAGETTATYMLVVEKISYITYRRVAVVLDTASADMTPDLEFNFVDTIDLIGGDANQDDLCKDDDRDTIMYYMMHDRPWSTAKDNTDMDAWKISVFNPEALAYACDLDGDGRISGADLNIQMADENYNRSEADYGSPSGLNFIPVVTTLEEAEKELPPDEETPPEIMEPSTPTLPEQIPEVPSIPPTEEEKPSDKDDNPPQVDKLPMLPELPATLPTVDKPKKEDGDENPTNSEKNDTI